MVVRAYIKLEGKSLVELLNKSNRPESLLSFGTKKHLPVILQTEAAECGLACMAMIMGYHGLEIDLNVLRHKVSISSHGTSLSQIIKIADGLGFCSRAIRLEIEDLAQLQAPCILHWEMNHFVVLKSISKGRITIHDPGRGERVLLLSEIGGFFTGVALELTPTPEFEKGEIKHSLKIGDFWSRISGFKRSLIQILCLSLVLQFFGILSPYYMQTVIDDAIVRNQTNLLLVLALGFGLLMLIRVFTSTLRQYILLVFSTKLSIQMSTNVFHHLLRLPMDYFGKRHIGDIVSRFGSLSNIRTLLTTGVISVVIDGLMSIITLAVMFMYNSTLSFIVICFLVIYALIRYIYYRPIRILTEENIVASAKENSHFMESIRAIQAIKLFGKEAERLGQWQNKLADAMNKGIQISRWNIGFGVVNSILTGIENILVVYFAAKLVIDNEMSVGMLFAFMSYKGRFVGSVTALIGKWIEFKMLSLHFDRLADIVLTEKDNLMNSSKGINALSVDKPLQGCIKVQDCSFRFSELDPPLLTDINFEINRGENVAIIGPSGGGKTTLLKCLMGLLHVERGTILIDETPIESVENYRQKIAAVLQDDQLLSGSLSENIACFDSNIDLEKVVSSAKLANIHEEITTMPMQYNTLVGDMGSGLSGGQMQRVLLARAFYRQPMILFLDEATSHLDCNNETIINEHIKSLSITRIFIAHRPETIMSAERVFELKSGKLTEINSELN